MTLALCSVPGWARVRMRQATDCWASCLGPSYSFRFLPAFLEFSHGPSFAAAFEFAGIEVDRERLAGSIELTAFEKLKAREQQSGFRERSRKAQRFFREGKMGGWKDVLTSGQVQRLCADHAAVMERFGYSAE